MITNFIEKYPATSQAISSERQLNETFTKIIFDIENQSKYDIFEWTKYPVKSLFDWSIEKSLNKFLSKNVVDRENYRKYENRNGNSVFDTSGIYIFWMNESPVYIGRSHRIVGRLKDHVCCSSRNTSSLGYSVAKMMFKEDNGFESLDKDILKDNSEYRVRARNFVKDLNVSFCYVDPLQDERLYILEVYLSMKYKVFLNKFKPH